MAIPQTQQQFDEALNKITEQSQQILNKFLANPSVHQNQLNHFKMMGELYSEFAEKMMSDPAKIAEIQMNYWKDYWELCSDSFQHWIGDQEARQPLMSTDDRRFKHEQWEKHPFFKFMKDFYLMTAEHIQHTVNNVEGLDEKTSHKLDFFTKQYIDAFSPSNFVLSNPEILHKTIETGGQNLIKGMQNMLDDIERSDGMLQIKMTDLNAFEVGKNLALTPGKVIFENDMIQLIQYEPTTPQVYSRPFLMVPPWINKYYILDLSPKNSFVQWIVNQGFTVFMISWVNPNAKHKKKDFSDYMESGVLAAINAIQKETNCDSVNALGFCIGGTLLAATLGYLAANNLNQINSATYLAAMIDFSDPGDMAAFIDENQISHLEAAMKEKGFLDGGKMSMTFNMLRANDLIWSYFIKNYLLGEDPFPFDMLFWNNDNTNMPYKMHSQYLRSMYLNNQLIQPGGMVLKDTPIDISKIKVPTYFLSTHHDHIAPWKTTYNGALAHSGDVTFVLGGSGHIAGVINHPDKNKYDYYVNSTLDKDPEVWFKNTKKIDGSWWPHWSEWLAKQSGEKVKARKINDASVIEDAPGSYVKGKLLVDE